MSHCLGGQCDCVCVLCLSIDTLEPLYESNQMSGELFYPLGCCTHQGVEWQDEIGFIFDLFTPPHLQRLGGGRSQWDVDWSSTSGVAFISWKELFLTFFLFSDNRSFRYQNFSVTFMIPYSCFHGLQIQQFSLNKSRPGGKNQSNKQTKIKKTCQYQLHTFISIFHMCGERAELIQ